MTLKRIAVVCPTGAHGIELGAIDALKECGLYSVEIHNNGAVGNVDRTLMIGPMVSHVRIVTELAKTMSTRMWYTEQPPFDSVPHQMRTFIARNRVRLERLTGIEKLPLGRYRSFGETLLLSDGVDFRVSTYSCSNRDYLKSYGIHAEAVPPGYFPELGQYLGKRIMDREIDVIFLGSTHGNRRDDIISILQSEFRRRGIRFVVVDGGHLGEPSLFGDHRTQILNDSKIMLSIGRNEHDDSVFRLHLAGANGAAVVVESANDSMTYPFRNIEQFVMADLKYIPDVIEDLLNDANKMQYIADNLHTAIMSMPIAQQIAKVVA